MITVQCSAGDEVDHEHDCRCGGRGEYAARCEACPAKLAEVEREGEYWCQDCADDIVAQDAREAALVNHPHEFVLAAWPLVVPAPGAHVCVVCYDCGESADDEGAVTCAVEHCGHLRCKACVERLRTELRPIATAWADREDDYLRGVGLGKAWADRGEDDYSWGIRLGKVSR